MRPRRLRYLRRRFFAARALSPALLRRPRCLSGREALPGSFVRPRRLRYGATAVDRSSGSRERLEGLCSRSDRKHCFLAFLLCLLVCYHPLAVSAAKMAAARPIAAKDS